MTYTYKDMKAEFRLTNDGDNWGTALAWWFAIADEIYFNRSERLDVPAEWKFRPSPMGPSNDPERYETEIVQGASDEALERFGALINRYAQFLKHCGKDY